ncbi:MAG: phosphatidylglycerophosphatase A [Ferruginibacter sp.]|nr:phosphatidylglycerophosphatase A [Ferruginibacter sp.]
MMKFHTLIASVLGIGYVGKGAGTVAAVMYCIIWFLLPAGYEKTNWQVVITILIFMVGTWSSGVVDSIWGRDSGKVVIDEVAGMAIALLYVPHHIVFVIISLVAFRFFDIVKPLGVRRAEILPKGWGVMADDFLAGLYALAVIQFCIWISK